MNFATRHSLNRLSRRGYTLVELIVAMTAATFLMAGLGSSLFIATRAFDGNSTALTRLRAAELQTDMMADLSQATEFVTRNTSGVSFLVPDRDGDGVEESISYSWTGLPDAEFHYSYNGSTPSTVLTDVQNYQLGFESRALAGSPLAPLDPSKWGERWDRRTFGYSNVYASSGANQPSTFGVRATLLANARVRSISCYLESVAINGRSDVRMAIYDTNLLGYPRNLRATTESFRADTAGWLELAVAPTLLEPGVYVLAISIKDTSKIASRYQLGASTVYLQNYDATRNGFNATWGASAAQHSAVASIYASYSTE